MSVWVLWAQAAPAVDVGEGLGFTFAKTLLVLFGVIALVYLTLNVGLRRLMGATAMPYGKSLVRVVDRVSLGQRQTVWVLRAAGEYWLVGGGPEGPLSLLGKLESAEVEKILNEPPPPSARPPGSAFLQKLLSRKDPQ